MDNERRQWETPNLTEYGSVEELTAGIVKTYGGNDGVLFDDGDGDDPQPVS